MKYVDDVSYFENFLYQLPTFALVICSIEGSVQFHIKVLLLTQYGQNNKPENTNASWWHELYFVF